MRRGARSLTFTGAVVLSVSLALPAVAFEGAASPERPGPGEPVVPGVGEYGSADFADEAATLPDGLVAAIDRDLGLTPEGYLAQSQRAIDAAKVLTALHDSGVAVNGGELDGEDVVIYVDSAEDVAAVEATGARAKVGLQHQADPAGVELEAADDLYGGEGWGYQVTSSGYLTCSIGIPGYNANGDDLIATAGHCFGIESSSTGTGQYDKRIGDPRSLNRDQPKLQGGSPTPGDFIGTLVPGSKQFGGGYDVGLLNTAYSNAIVRPQVVQWGATGFDPSTVGTGGPFDSTPFVLTGQTAGFVGAPICKSGATTGWTCGTISAVDWNVSVSGKTVNSIKSNVCVIPGDSGGIAVVGTEAAGLTSGGNHVLPNATQNPYVDSNGDGCADSGYYDLDGDPETPDVYVDFLSVFFHVVDTGLPDLATGMTDTLSITDKFGSDFTVCTGPVPVVSSLAPGGDPDGPAPLNGKVPCIVAGESTTVALYLDGSPTPVATQTPTDTAGSFSFSLAGVPVGTHSYVIEVAWGAETSTATGNFDIVDRSSIPSRLAGGDRYATASAIAAQWDQDFDASVVFIATGENYPDALSAAAAGSYLGAPVLLTKKSSLPSATKARLDALQPDTIVVLGSTAAISSSVFNQLKTVTGSPTVTRLSGSDRYDTARKILDYAFDDGHGGLVDVPSIVIATGQNFPDALSAAPAVSRDGGAVILVDGTQSSIPAATLALIDDLDPDRIFIAGSTKVVKKAIETQLDKRYGGAVVSRIAGADRYETSRLITDRYWGDASAVFFAVGTNYPDALAGAALAGALASPLIVTEKSCMSSGTRSLVLSLAAEQRVLLGSSSVLSSSIASIKVC